MSATSMLANLKMSTKILSAFGLVLSLVIGISLIAIDRLPAVNDRAVDVRDSWLPSAGVLGQLFVALRDFRVSEARYILAGDDGERQQAAAELNKRSRLSNAFARPTNR